MQGPIYKFFRLTFTEAYYLLSPAEREQLMHKEEAISQELGVKMLMVCNTAWNNEAWQAWGVAEYANMDQLARHSAGLVALDWFRYINAETMLGTAWQG